MKVLTGTHYYSTRANWKLLPVNVIDGSHFMPTHITYLEHLKDRGSDVSSAIRDYNETDLGNGHTVYEYEASWGRPLAKPDKSWGEEVNAQIGQLRRRLAERLGEERADRIARKNRNLVIFPNLVINDIVGITIRVAEPTAIDYMEVTAWELAPVDEPPEVMKVRNSNFLTFLGPAGLATPDDIEGMEASQRAFAAYREVPWANFSKGMALSLGTHYAPGESDANMRTYWRHWRKLMSEHQSQACA